MNLIELKKGEQLYNSAKKSYDVVYNNIMSRGRMHQTPTFLGGRSTLLEREHFSDLVRNDYLVSLRSATEGRFLMLIGEVDENSSEARYIFFIGTASKVPSAPYLTYWVINDLPSISGCAQMLFDGELLTHNNLIYNASDLLYGPSTPTFEDESSRLKLNLGASFAMIGPKANSRWPFYKRYDILKKVVLNEYSPIYQYISRAKGTPFRMVVSPYFSVKDLFLKYNDVRQVQNHIAKHSIASTLDDRFVFTKNNDLCGDNKTLIAAPRGAEGSIDLKLLCVVFKPSNTWGTMYRNRIIKQLIGTVFDHRCRLSKNPCKLLGESFFSLQKLVEQFKQPTAKSKIYIKTKLNIINPNICGFFRGGAEPEPCAVYYYKHGKGEIVITNVILGAHRIQYEILDITPITVLTIPSNEIMQKCGYGDASLAKPLITTVENVFKLLKHSPQVRPQRYRYQKKYEINGMPENHTPNILWRLDITIYGESTTSEDLAKKNFTDEPKTEISVKYAPGEQEMNALAYYNLYPNEETLQQFSLRSARSAVTELNERIRKIQNLPTSVIMQDYCRTIMWILNTMYSA